MKSMKLALGLLASVALPSVALATDLEVTHWWTSGGEAAAVAELATAFDATGNKWVDGAIAGSGDTARPIMISRITGGDPMGATQFNHGRQAQELVEAGLFRDLTDVATRENWAALVNPPTLLENCTLDGKIYCVPVNIHSWQWLWLSNGAFEKAGVAVPANWNEFVAAAPALEAAGITPLAMGKQPWQQAGAFNVLMVGVGGSDLFLKVYKDKDAAFAAGPEVAAVFKAADDARKMAAGSNVQNWNEATSMVINATAGGQIMGDWAQGEFQVAGQTAGKEYTCLPGLGLNEVISTGGDAFYFPKLDDAEKSAAQDVLASVMMAPATQVAFNLKKGSLPVRGDVDLSTANDCMQKGLKILAAGGVIQSSDELIDPDSTTQINDLFASFFSDMAMTPEDAQARFAELIGAAQ
jgi:glucose/mannose transport system substrate-binding protein